MVTDYNTTCQTIFSLLDLTSLNATDDEKSISTLCQKAIRPPHHVAAVCVYPAFVKQAAALLGATPVKIATVANFPAGRDALSDVLPMIALAFSDGAHEIDVVFPYQAYLKGETDFAADFIQECKQACGKHTLKVILETGALPDLATVASISRMAIDAGADFLKTSTGKIPQGASLGAASCMLDVIKKSSRPVGFKVSGGVRTPKEALQYMMLAEHCLGPDWVTPEHFRIGASQLVDQLLLDNI